MSHENSFYYAIFGGNIKIEPFFFPESKKKKQYCELTNNYSEEVK